jgi:hypothetical protein
LISDNPDNIRGYGFKGIVVDEAAVIPPDVWNYILRPTIAQTAGWAVFISTPKGRNWFYDLFMRGLDPEEKEYHSFKFTAVSKAEIVQRLIVSVEQQRVSWPAEWRILTHEMQRYEYEISPRGHISYNAPSGFHDDCVMALALANHRRWTAESCGPMLPLVPKGRFSPFSKRPRSLFG